MGAGWDAVTGTGGIYVTDIPLMTYFNKVFGSTPDFGFSQIEYAHDGNMYASSTLASNNVGGFNPSLAIPILNTTFTLTPNPINNNQPPGIPGLKTLPDQIDGQDYSAILSSPITPTVVTTSAYVCSTGVATNWNGGSNPWNPANIVHVNQLLLIKDFTHLTITGMTFKFSPKAKVIIEQGSSLTLNGTTFTSDADPDNCPSNLYNWQGVEVWGGSQFNANDQGKLTLTNNSRLQYAQLAGRAWNSDLLHVNETREIIQIATHD